MFKQTNKIKAIISKLYLANKSFKKRIYIKRTSLSLVILENLQKQGVIYGFLKQKNFFMIFLKFYGLERLCFINKKITKNNLFTFEKTSLYFLINNKGLVIVNILTKKSIGNNIIAKI